jgi:4-amino-4-deoxy-L-arabinose transferase-like glycosyltransferase
MHCHGWIQSPAAIARHAQPGRLMSAPVLARSTAVRALRAARRPAAGVVHAAALTAAALGACALRFTALGSMPLNPYYDAAVRSMGSSWHAFIMGAFDPNASVAVDKPPLDLWLQVASTKLFGFTALALHLPQALASTVAVLLLYDLVRRTIGRGAGLAAAALFAVLPAEVMTARSDTMDAVMAALLVLATWLVVRAFERGRPRELYLAGAVVGLAFETKVFEALVPVPALALLFLLGSAAPVRVRLRQLAAAGVAMCAVGLAWPLTFALLQHGTRPYPAGSSDGSIWSTVFGYNGIGRLNGTSTHTFADRLSPVGPARLFSAGPLHLGAVMGTSLAAALAVALAGVVLGVVRRHHPGRVALAMTLGIAVWVIAGGVLLSFMAHLQVRYLEVLTPAIAALFGIGIGLLAQAGMPRFGRLTATAAVVLAGAALIAPAAESVALVQAGRGDGGALGAMPAGQSARLARYLSSHRGGARYEYAALEAHLAGPLIAADGQPVLILAGTPYHPLVSTHGLAAAVHAGQVRYVLTASRGRSRPPHPSLNARTPRGRMAGWVRVHGVDVTAQAGLPGYGVLYRLTAQGVRG